MIISKNGLTMIEMLIVLLIISIVITISFPMITTNKDLKTIELIKSDITYAQAIVEKYYAAKGELPQTELLLEDLDNNGKSDIPLGNEEVLISKNNKLSFTNNSNEGKNCYIIEGSNKTLSKKIIIDSCLDNIMHII